MSERSLDQKFIDMIRGFEDRLKKLESSTNNAVRKNDIRLSDTVITADSVNDRLCLHNLVTDQIVCIGEAEELEESPGQAIWSFSGALADHEGEFSPAFLVEQPEVVARQIIVAQRCGDSFTGDVTLCVNFACSRVLRSVVLNGADQYAVYEVNIPLVENDSISIQLIVGVDAENISVFVRFGTPTVSETTGNECEQ